MTGIALSDLNPNMIILKFGKVATRRSLSKPPHRLIQSLVSKSRNSFKQVPVAQFNRRTLN